MKALVSIIIPFYNSDLFLSDAIQSILDQTYENWELFLVNDGSTDNSGSIAQSFKDPRMMYFEQNNKGVSAARNQGLSLMNGDYFCFLDADDILPRKSIESRLDFFTKHEEVSFVDGTVQSYDQDMVKETSTWYPFFKGAPYARLLMLDQGCFFGITWMIRRDRSVDYRFDEELKFGEDLWFYIRISQNQTRSYSYVDEVIYKRRERKGSATNVTRSLALGYHHLYQKISSENMLDKVGINFLRRKMKKIVLKCALGELDFKLVFAELFRRW